jgi:hypothetical protein
VTQSRGDLDLAQKALVPQRGREVVPDDLDGDVAPVLLVACEVHTRHPATSQLSPDPVPSGEHLRQSWVGAVARELAEALRSRVVQERHIPLGLSEQLFEPALPRRVPATQFRNVRSTLLGWHVEQFIEQWRQLVPVRRKPRPFTVRRVVWRVTHGERY